MSEHAGRADRPCRSALQAFAGRPFGAGERNDQEAQ